MAPHRRGDAPPLVLPPDLVPRVAGALAEARLKYGELGLSEAEFGGEVLRQARAHWARQGLELTPSRLADYARRAALADLVLGAACEAGSARGWQVLRGQFAPRLEGFAVRRGASSQDAESIVQDLLGDLSMPPARAGTRTLLGTFDATGSLFGWLSVVLLRRLAGQARKRKPTSLEAQPEDEREQASLPGRPTAAAPALSQLLDRETSGRLEAAVARAWSLLSSQERFALVLKHRDDRTQREIGGLLGVGEARVSRIVGAAVARLNAGVQSALDGGQGPEAGGAAWQLLLAALSKHLASQGPQVPPSSGKVGGGERRAAGEVAPQDEGQA